MAPERSLPKSVEELLVEQFYGWEKRGRGWSVFPERVALEPAFRPFLGHYLLPGRVEVDDGRKHTLLSGLVERFLPRDRPMKQSEERFALESLLREPDQWCEEGDPLSGEFVVVLPAGTTVVREASAKLLLAVSSATGVAAFEVVGDGEEVSVGFACEKRAGESLVAQIRTFCPEAVVVPARTTLAERWSGAAGQGEVAEFGLSREFMLPLETPPRFDLDPLLALFGAMERVEAREFAALQVLFQRARNPWAESMMRAVTSPDGADFFDGSGPNLTRAVREKTAELLFAVAVRTAAKGLGEERTWEILRAIAGSLDAFGCPQGNEFIPLEPEADRETLVSDFLDRRTHRSGMLLSLAELASLAHLPSASVRSSKLPRIVKRTKAVPPTLSGEGVLLGENCHEGRSSPVRLPDSLRLRHTHILGASGSGKSTLLLRMILEDIRRGTGVALLDPHGDLVEDILARIPGNRDEDVVLVDPSDEEFPVGLNILSAHSELERNLLASDLVAVFRRLSTSWGDQMNSILANAIQAFLESEEGGTLADLRRFLIDPHFRERFLTTVRDREVVYYWKNEFRLLVGKPQGPILTRLDAFLRPKLLRYLVSQRANKLDFRKVLDDRKVLLVKLSEGAIGEENAALLGSLLVSKLHQAAMSRTELSRESRHPFFLYLDEFHHFVTPSMAALLSSARKYGVGLVLAHQELRQLQERDPGVLSAALANAATRVVFRVNESDAKILEDGFSDFESSDLLNLGVGEAICRVERREADFNLRTADAEPVSSASGSVRESAIAHSREKYARSRAEVERERYAGMEAEGKQAVVHTLSERAVTPPIPTVRRIVGTPVEPRVTRELGRGGPEHKYLQELVKKFGESRGYQATIEKQILEGLGSVDVALERKDHTIACEISVSSTTEQEYRNLEKCLAAGFDEVALVSLVRKTLVTVQELVVGSLEQQLRDRVHFFTPEEFFAHLNRKCPGEKEETVSGYRVRVAYRGLVEEEGKNRGKALAAIVGRTIRRLTGEQGKR